MIKNYLKIAWRNLLRNKVYSLVNIVGLAIGMAACFFVFQYVHFESGYDRFHANASNIYRVPISFSANRLGGADWSVSEGNSARNHPAVGLAMKNDFPEVIDYTRVVNLSLFEIKFAMSYNPPGRESKVFNEDNIFMADSSFFTLFSYPLIKGSKEHCLTATNNIVISTSTAKKYFGNSDPMDQTLTLNAYIPWVSEREFPFKVTGVFADVPENSHLKFDMLIPFEAYRRFLAPGTEFDNMWVWPGFFNYVLLSPGTDVKKLEAKFPAFIEKYLGPIMKQYNFRTAFRLQPITDIHLKSNYTSEAEVNGSEEEVHFLSIIGVFILIIAWINYINLSTAKSMERAKEVGIRKVSGAVKRQLIGQFLLESFLINLVALATAILIIATCMPLFDRFMGKNISGYFFSSGLGSQPVFWVAASIVFVAGALLVGAYPAFVLSVFKPVRVLKGLIITSNKGLSLRRALVSFQFLLSILLIAATLIVFNQLRFMRNSDLGYKKEQRLVVKSPAVVDSTFTSRFYFLKSEILKLPSVTNAAPSSDVPGAMIRQGNFIWLANQDKEQGFVTRLMQIDHDFLKTYDIKLLAGRNFLPSDSSFIFSTPNNNVLINEETAGQLGFKSPGEAVNREIVFDFGGEEIHSRVLGVVKNYHQRSFKEKHDPILFFFPSWGGWKYMSVNINTAHLHDNLAIIESIYKKVFPGNPFEYFFQDDFFNRQHLTDQRLGKVFGLFTILAIIVACLGLLGLSSFVIRLRTKEIGIRKVLGASVSGILLLISKDFVKQVCLSAGIAMPIIYWVGSNWLNNYAFHIRLAWYIFIIPPLMLLLIALLTIGLQSLKAALANPVKSLRVE